MDESRPPSWPLWHVLLAVVAAVVVGVSIGGAAALVLFTMVYGIHR